MRSSSVSGEQDTRYFGYTGKGSPYQSALCGLSQSMPPARQTVDRRFSGSGNARSPPRRDPETLGSAGYW